MVGRCHQSFFFLHKSSERELTKFTFKISNAAQRGQRSRLRVAVVVVAVVVVVRVFFQAVNAPAQIHFGAPCFSSHLVPPVTHGSGEGEVGGRGKREKGRGVGHRKWRGVGGKEGNKTEWIFDNTL